MPGKVGTTLNGVLAEMAVNLQSTSDQAMSVNNGGQDFYLHKIPVLFTNPSGNASGAASSGFFTGTSRSGTNLSSQSPSALNAGTQDLVKASGASQATRRASSISTVYYNLSSGASAACTATAQLLGFIVPTSTKAHHPRINNAGTTPANSTAWRSTGDRLGTIVGFDWNSTADQTIPIKKHSQSVSLTVVGGIAIYANSGTSITTAAGGVYTGTSKSGTAVIPAATTYTGITNSTSASRAEVVTSDNTLLITADQLYLSLTTAQGSAGTATATIVGLEVF